MKDALVPTGEEGRGKLRKAAGICKRDSIRRYPNGTTRQGEDLSHRGSETRGSETSQYPQEKKSTEIAQVVASERAAG